MNLTKLAGLVLLTVVSAYMGYKIGETESSRELSQSDRSRSTFDEHGDPGASTDTTPEGAYIKTSEQSLSLREIFDGKDDIGMYASLKRYFEGLSSDNIESYLEDIETLPPSSKKTQFLNSLFRRWGEVDGPAAFAYASSYRGRDRGFYISTAAEGWASREPIKAFEALMVVSNNGAMSNIPSFGVIREIARKDLRMGTQLALGIQRSSTISINGGAASSYGMASLLHGVERDGDFRDLLPILVEESAPSALGSNLEALFQSWGKYEFEGPLETIKAMGDGEQSSNAMSGFLKGWALADGEEAFLYAIENQDDATIGAAISDIARSWVGGATAEEVGEIVSRFASIEDKSFLSSSIFYRLTQANPESSMELAASIQDKRQRDQSIRSVTSQWARQDLAQAEQYVQALEDESFRSTATTMLISSHISNQSDPDSILSLADNFEDPKMSESVLTNIVLNATSSRNRSKSQGLIDALNENLATREGLSEESRKRLLDRLNRE